ncbi:MAG: FAD-dependent oxidoreductase [Alphaproteobacteria bacterium]|nr:FAD-dependent oxidoreductase [Alphaproteobacteria bacterium]MDA7983486.1 FAD-dependent oxidoreductase [Alphaproteobacteria bacterium]MDA7989120.1 FAD-dependent oxidoreductase [Alphaproteobacteria bacterium]MDA8009656.1 FAD-dependent oxidoreductase [Alphaproteobacteria bacterium]
MTKTLSPDICIIGAGSAGLSLAAGAAQLGADVVLIEEREMGGDCLNFGCVPSKALISAAKLAAVSKKSSPLGVELKTENIGFQKVHDHIHEVIASIAPHDSQERFEGLGCTVIREHAQFVDSATLQAGEYQVRARDFVIATGSRPLVPPIPGLADTPHLTNETVFGLKEMPRSLIVLGGGPIGCELAQSFARLGAEVHVLELARLLPRDDAEAAALVHRSLVGDGVQTHEGHKAVRVEATEAGGVRVHAEADGREVAFEADRLLVALGRVPSLDNLGLDAAGVRRQRAGVEHNERLRTSNKRVWVAGDAAGELQFTHVAGYHAGLLVRNLLFRMPARISRRAVPWVTYTEPELAQVGLTEEAAKKGDPKVTTARFDFAENDRARATRSTEGFVRAVVDSRGRVVGCTIVGDHAGELILPWVLLIESGMKLSRMASVIAPYPTLSEASKRAAGSWYTPSLFSPRTRKIVRLLGHLPRL